MAAHHNQQVSGVRRGLRRLFLSAFVVVSLAAYALHKPASEANGSFASGAANPNQLTGQQGLTPTQSAPTDSPTATQADNSGNAPTPDNPTQPPSQEPPTATAPASTPTTAVASGEYKDGTYTGPQVDAYYGLVQVQAVVQNGKISNVQFLQYPNDRRTSVRINSYAVPILQQEAVQAQNANVDLITGATLTSQAFQESLQTALQQAQP